jgi:hypothetical protein
VRGVILIAGSSAVLAVFSFLATSHMLLDDGFGLGVLLVAVATVATLVAAVMWARRASIEGVVAAILVIALSLLIFMNRVHLGFDDGRILVAPLAIMVVISLLGGLATSRRTEGGDDSRPPQFPPEK